MRCHKFCSAISHHAKQIDQMPMITPSLILCMDKTCLHDCPRMGGPEVGYALELEDEADLLYERFGTSLR